MRTRKWLFGSVVSGLLLLTGNDLRAATVTATLKNVGGANTPAAGTRLVLYTSPSRQVSGSNPATFNSVSAGTYTLEGYYTGTFWGEEYWGSMDVTVPSSGTVSPNLTRHYPYASSVVIKNHSTGATITPGQSVQSGTQLRAEVTIQNNTSSALNCRPHVAIDRSQSASYDFDLTWTAQSVASGGSRLFSQTFTPTTTGQYYYAHEVSTTLLNGNTLRTDSAGWQQTFQIVCPTPGAPSTPSPSNGASGVNPTSVTLSWSAASGAASYDVYFGTDSTPDSGEYAGNTTQTQWPVSGLSEATTYYWKIVAINSCGSTDGSVWSFTTARTTGDLNVTLKNASGANAPAAGCRIVLYTSPSRQVAGTNPASFTFVPPSTFTVEGYYSGTFWGEEFWASQDVTISAGQTTAADVRRRYPYSLSTIISNVTSGGLISPAQAILAGTQVRAYVVVSNAVSSTALNARARFVFDTSQSEPYGEFDSTSAFQSVPANASRVFTFTFTTAATGQYYFAYKVETTLLNGTTLSTDSAGWQQTFSVIPNTGEIGVTLQNVSGANAPASGTRMVLYTSPSLQTSGVNPATYTSVPAGIFTLEGYYTGSFWGEELWASQDIAVVAGQSTPITVPRRYPLVSQVAVSNVLGGGLLSPGQAILAGTPLRAFVTVSNGLASTPLSSRVRFVFDLSQSQPYGEFDNTSGFQVLPALGKQTFVFDFTPSFPGSYYFSYKLETTLLSGTTLPTDSAGWQPTFQAITLPGRLAYHSYSDYLAAPVDADDGHIYLFQMPSGPLRKLTQALPVQNAMNPHVSSNGALVTFMAIPQGAAREYNSLEIYVYDLAEDAGTSSLTRLTSNAIPDEDPKFSPDGQKIVFKRSGQIWRMNADGTGTAQLTSTAREKSGPVFTPDGSRIVFWYDSKSSADIGWMASDTPDSDTVLFGQANTQEMYPVFRNSDTILYSRWESADANPARPNPSDDVYAYSISSGTQTRLGSTRFNLSSVEDADAFPVGSAYVGISSTRSVVGARGSYDIYVGSPEADVVYQVPGINSQHQDLGGWYTPFSLARKLVVQNPTSGSPLTAGTTILLRVRALSNGGTWSGATPKVVLQGPTTIEFLDLRDDGTSGDQTAGDGVYSKSVSLPTQTGNYSVSSVADSADGGTTQQIRSLPVAVSIQDPPDTTPPTVIISSPTSGQTLTATPVTVSGTASDPGSPASGVSLVEVRNNSGTWQAASGTTAWSRSVALVSGANVIEARSKDVAGLYSTLASVSVNYTLPNNAPSQPTNLSPINASSNQLLTPTLQASAFTDPDAGDTHAASQWLLKRSGDAVVVFDSGEDAVNRTTCAVPAGRLMHSTNYTWHVRYKDSRGMWSDYSAQTAFSTVAPTVAARVQGNTIVFTWSTNAPGFILMSCTNLTTNVVWDQVSPAPAVVFGQNVVSNIPSGLRMFYRLKRP